jgi:hypothetical protein
MSFVEHEKSEQRQPLVVAVRLRDPRHRVIRREQQADSRPGVGGEPVRDYRRVRGDGRVQVIDGTVR